MIFVILGTQSTLHFGKSAIIDVFTNDPEVKALAMSTFWIMAVVTFFDTIQGLAQGVIRALALQKQASYIALAAYYLVTIPLACLLCFVGNMNVGGLWTGVGVGCFLQAYFYIHLCKYTADWDKIADEAYKRVQSEALNSFENSFASMENKKMVSSDKFARQDDEDEESEFVGSIKETLND